MGTAADRTLRTSSPIARRISRLERAAAGRHDEPVEYEHSDETKALLRKPPTGLKMPEEIEAPVNDRRLVPKSLLRPSRPPRPLENRRDGFPRSHGPFEQMPNPWLSLR